MDHDFENMYNINKILNKFLPIPFIDKIVSGMLWIHLFVLLNRMQVKFIF